MSSLGCHPRHAASERELETRNNQTSLRIKMDQLTFITRHLVINLFTGVKYHQASYIFCRMLLSLITFSRFDTRMQRGSQFARFFVNIKTLVDGQRNSRWWWHSWHRCVGGAGSRLTETQTRGLKLVLAIGWCRGAGAYSWEPLIIPHIPVWAGLCREFLENVSETEYLYSWRSCFGRIRTNTGLVTGIMLYAFKVILRVSYRILFVWALCDWKWAWLNA